MCTRKLALWCRIWHLRYHQPQPNRTELRTLPVPFCFPVLCPKPALISPLLLQFIPGPHFLLWLLSGKGMPDFQVPQNPDYDTLVRHDQLSVRKQIFLMLSSLSPLTFFILRNEVLTYSEVYSTDLGFNLKIWGSVENFGF